MISQFLLYFDAFWILLGMLMYGVGGGLGGVLAIAALAAYLYGAYGIANELKTGYKVAVVASFLPLARRILLVVFNSTWVDLNYGSTISFVLIGGNIINAIFEYALIALLLHQQSREHQRIWFS